MYVHSVLMCRRYQRLFHESLSFADINVAIHNCLFTLSM